MTSATTAPASAAAVLADGLAELAATTDHDLRDRLRGLQREADAWLVANDPADDWPAFERWLGERAAREIADNHAGLRRAAHRLAAEAGVAVDVAIASPTPPAAESLLTPKRPAGTELALTTLRGACSGVITAGLLGSLAGLAVAAPAAVAVGLAFGGKTLADDRKRHLTTRRAEARTVVQRYVDEVLFQCANASRASLREVQRRFRAAVAGTTVTAVNDEQQRTVALEPIRRTVEHPPIATVTKSPRLGVLAAVTIVLIAALTAAIVLHRDDATASTVTAAAPAADDASTLVANLVAATRDGRADVLVDTLHPAVIDRYGLDTCRTYLATAGVFPLDLVVRETSTAASWDWQTDGVVTRIHDVALVEVSRVVGGETVLQELHVARAGDGSLRWFTDCGDPVSR